jgi:hypothetical protein
MARLTPSLIVTYIRHPLSLSDALAHLLCPLPLVSSPSFRHLNREFKKLPGFKTIYRYAVLFQLSVMTVTLLKDDDRLAKLPPMAVNLTIYLLLLRLHL